MQADEVFTSGTAVVVCSVGSITYKGVRRQYGEKGQPGGISLLICALHQTSNSASEAWSEVGAADRSEAADSLASGISFTQVLQLLQFILKNVFNTGPVTLELYEALTALQQERAPDDFGWVVPIV